ncbi:unnamed protein product [Trichobilharzia regenti]|nr:unnamed protein product [Trichobilharzia regenti]
MHSSSSASSSTATELAKQVVASLSRYFAKGLFDNKVRYQTLCVFVCCKCFHTNLLVYLVTSLNRRTVLIKCWTTNSQVLFCKDLISYWFDHEMTSVREPLEN